MQHQTWFTSLPGFEIHLSLQAEQALLNHPLVIQELGPGGRDIRGLTQSVLWSGFPPPHALLFVNLTAWYLHVVSDRVGEDDHTALPLLQLLSHVHCGCHDCARAATCIVTGQSLHRRNLKISTSRHVENLKSIYWSVNAPHRSPSSRISLRDIVNVSRSVDLYHMSTTCTDL